MVDVYGPWARDLVSIRLWGVPNGQWSVGGKIVDNAVAVAFSMRANVFDRPDAAEVLTRLGTGITEAIAGVLGEEMRQGVMIEFVATPASHTFVGGHPAP